MAQLFGDYIDFHLANVESLTLAFSASARPIDARWSNCRLTAQYVAEFAAEWFATHAAVADASTEDFADAVNFAANELLENALKYAHEPSRSGHCLRLALHPQGARLYLCNKVERTAAERFQVVIERLLSSDPLDYYAEQVERNAQSDDSTQSGLGLVTIIDLHDGELAWKFLGSNADSDSIEVITMVSLPR